MIDREEQEREIKLDQEIGERLVRLRDATDSINPHPQFTARLMARLELEHSWLWQIPSLWRRALPVAVLLATLSAVWAYRTTHDVDAQLAVASDSDEAAEMDW